MYVLYVYMLHHAAGTAVGPSVGGRDREPRPTRREFTKGGNNKWMETILCNE